MRNLSRRRLQPASRLLAVAVLAGGALALTAGVATTASATTAPTETSSSAAERPLHGQTPVVGYFRGSQIRYLDDGPVQLAKDAAGHYLSDVDPIWAVTNGVAGQHNIIDDVPGLNSPNDYTPLWQVVKVTWRPGVTPRLLTSADAVAAAASSGQVSTERTDIIVNCPVLGFNQPTTKGFFRDEGVRYFDFGAIHLAKDAAGNFLSDVDPIWAVTNGVAQQRNVIDNVPNLNRPDDYTPLWQVVTVTFKPGVRPFLLESAADVQAAVRHGQVSTTTLDLVVNCPVL